MHCALGKVAPGGITMDFITPSKITQGKIGQNRNSYGNIMKGKTYIKL